MASVASAAACHSSQLPVARLPVASSLLPVRNDSHLRPRDSRNRALMYETNFDVINSIR